MVTIPDTAAAHELALWAVNDGDLYDRQARAILDNLARKIVAGTYDADKAPTLWGYLADTAAQKYTKAHGTPGGSSFGIFGKATRQLAAVEIGEHYAEMLEERAAELAMEREARKPVKRTYRSQVWRAGDRAKHKGAECLIIRTTDGGATVHALKEGVCFTGHASTFSGGPTFRHV